MSTGPTAFTRRTRNLNCEAMARVEAAPTRGWSRTPIGVAVWHALAENA